VDAADNGNGQFRVLVIIATLPIHTSGLNPRIATQKDSLPGLMDALKLKRNPLLPCEEGGPLLLEEGEAAVVTCRPPVRY
jgi:hypothetical protein